jgi:hypothetical protein
MKVGFKGDIGRFLLTKLQVVDERYEEFTIEDKQSLKINIRSPSDFKMKCLKDWSSSSFKLILVTKMRIVLK